MKNIESLRTLAHQLKSRKKIAKRENASISVIADSPTLPNAYIQWTSTDNSTFFPAARVVQQIPPGYYTIGSTMDGQIFFRKKDIKPERLIKFPDSACDAVTSEIENFWKLESRFADSGFPYRRGIILYGPPGSGKTCIIRLVIDNLVSAHSGIVVDFDDPWMFERGYEILRGIHANMPLVVLMEDLDSTLQRYSESDVLNVLDGVRDIHKAVFLATTNYPEKLGSRILNRPSRFDKKFFIAMPNRLAREMFIRSRLENESEIQKWADDTDGLSIAHIKELFVATKILGDSYDEALGVLKEMRSTPSSELFDDFEIKHEPAFWGGPEKSGKSNLIQIKKTLF